MCLPYRFHAAGMLLPLPCGCPAAAMQLPCRCHPAAIPLPLSCRCRCHVTAVSLTKSLLRFRERSRTSTLNFARIPPAESPCTVGGTRPERSPNFVNNGPSLAEIGSKFETTDQALQCVVVPRNAPDVSRRAHRCTRLLGKRLKVDAPWKAARRIPLSWAATREARRSTSSINGRCLRWDAEAGRD